MWLCAENADAGRRNGAKVGALAETQGGPIIRYESMRNNIAAKRLKTDEFNGVRTLTHLAHGGMLCLFVIKYTVWVLSY